MSSTGKQASSSLRKKKRVPGGKAPAATDVDLQKVWREVGRAQALYRASAMDRVRLVRSGVPARYTRVLALGMEVTKEKLYSTVGLARATVGILMPASGSQSGSIDPCRR